MVLNYYEIRSVLPPRQVPVMEAVDTAPRTRSFKILNVVPGIYSFVPFIVLVLYFERITPFLITTLFIFLIEIGIYTFISRGYQEKIPGELYFAQSNVLPPTSEEKSRVFLLGAFWGVIIGVVLFTIKLDPFPFGF